MVSLRRHTHLRLCAGRTSTAQLPWYRDNRTAPQNASHAKSKRVHRMRSINAINQPKGNTTATGASAKSFTDLVLALPAFATVGSQSGYSRRGRRRFKTDGNSRGAKISLSSQVKDRDSQTLQFENKMDSLRAVVNKLKEENTLQNGELEMQQPDLEMLEFNKLLLQTVENLCGNVEHMQRVDLLMGEPNRMQLREVLQKVEKLREDLRRADSIEPLL